MWKMNLIHVENLEDWCYDGGDGFTAIANVKKRVESVKFMCKSIHILA